MLNIYKEIGEMQQKSSDLAAKTLKESHRYKVEEALKFFKTETLRLSKIYKENEAEIGIYFNIVLQYSYRKLEENS